jgi:hypothetical protein
VERLGERERGSGAGEHDGRGVLRRLRAETHRTVLREVRPRLRGDRRSAACQLSFGNPGRSSAACRLVGDRRSAAGHLFFDSRSAAGRLSCDRRSAADSLSYFTSGALPLCADWHARTRTSGFTLGKNITGWQDGPMARFLKPMSASAAVGQVSPSDGVEAIEAARKARDALSSTKLSAALRKERDESAGIKDRTTLATEFFVRQFKIRGGSGFGKGTGGGRPGKNDKLLSNRVLRQAIRSRPERIQEFQPFRLVVSESSS